jgi:hypothetical protein
MASISSSLQTSEWDSPEDWQLASEKDPPVQSLIVQERKYVHVFPYFRLVWVEGDNSRVQLHYDSHTVVINGHGLAQLLSGLAAHRVLRVMEPMSNEAKFRKGPIVLGILVSKNDHKQEEAA